jgi:acylphosphatase
LSGERLVKRSFRIKGRVQGVFFRAWTREMAREIGVGGMVRNRPDGSVEAHFVGTESAVARMEERLWEGPPASRVEAVEPIDTPPEVDGNSFRIVH